MKLRELSDEIAAACNVRATAVLAVQAETFRKVQAALDQGEKVQIPGFGIFSMKDAPGADGKPPRRSVRLKQRDKEKTGEKAPRTGRSKKTKTAAAEQQDTATEPGFEKPHEEADRS